MIISRNLDYFEMLLDKTRNNNGVINADMSDVEKIKNAFEKSHDIRKFEIGLYWQRSGYILGFISVLAAAIAYCFSTYVSDTTENKTKFILLMTISCLAIIGISLCSYWKRILKASKYWQENWQYNIEILEPYVSGNLHKIHFYRSDEDYNRFSIHEVVLSISNRITIILFIIITYSFALIMNNTVSFIKAEEVTNEYIYLSFAPLMLIYLTIEVFVSYSYRKKDKQRIKSRTMIRTHLKVTVDKINCSKD